VDITVRAATAADRSFVIDVGGRLVDFGLPAWRSEREIVAREQRSLTDFFDRPAPGMAVYVAVDGDQQPLGFVYLTTEEDYFTGDNVGHVDILAVDRRAEGRGVGTALMHRAEIWARASGYRRLSLNVFDGNGRARTLYERLGYRAETLHYVKAID
jgi:GNAT superfamily N-acetyltransferase